MKKIKKKVEIIIYLSYDGIEFKDEHNCILHEAEQRFYDLCDSGKLLNAELNKPVHFDDVVYIVDISKEELEMLNESLDRLGYRGIEPTSKSGNYYWAGNEYKSLESFDDVFKKESKDD